MWPSPLLVGASPDIEALVGRNARDADLNRRRNEVFGVLLAARIAKLGIGRSRSE